jgi:hypothetical protein
MYKSWGRSLALLFIWLNLIAIIGRHLEDRTWPETSEIAIGLLLALFAIVLFRKALCQLFEHSNDRITS